MNSPALLPLFLAVVSPALVATSDAPSLYIYNNEIWVGRGRELKQITRDGVPKQSPSLDPSGKQIGYWTTCAGGSTSESCPPRLVFIDLSGSILFQFPAPMFGHQQPCLSITRLDWVAEDRVGVDCHINPSLGLYSVIDLGTARAVAGYYGFGFAWSPHRKHLAHAGWIPHFAPRYAKSGYLRVDDRTLYPKPLRRTISREPQRDYQWSDVVEVSGPLYRGIHEFRSGFAWSPDGSRIAFVDRIYDWKCEDAESARGEEMNERWLLVVASLREDVLSIPVQRLDGAPIVRWDSPSTLTLHAGNHARRFRVSATAVTRIAPRP